MFCGMDGTRTRDLLRDRQVSSVNKYLVINQIQVDILIYANIVQTGGSIIVEVIVLSTRPYRPHRRFEVSNW